MDRYKQDVMQPIICDNNTEKYLRVKYLFVLSYGCLNVHCLRRSRVLCVALRFTSALPQLSLTRKDFLRRLAKIDDSATHGSQRGVLVIFVSVMYASQGLKQNSTRFFLYMKIALTWKRFFHVFMCSRCLVLMKML